MIDNFYNVFLYLEKEDIKIDKKEFLFQVQSHPDHPTLLAITDTLSFFNIDNGVLRVAFEQIKLLPQRFLAILKENGNETHIYLVEQQRNGFYITRDNKSAKISIQDLESRWGEFILLAEKEEVISSFKSKNKLFWFGLSVCTALYLILFIAETNNFSAALFILFPIIGLLLSVAALKDLFGTSSEIISAFCNMSSFTSCTTVVDSKKWKIFNFINLGDLSIVFFTFQFLLFSIALITGSVDEFIFTQKILLYAALPVIIISIYYQKVVEKKWCPLCLAIIGLLFLEFGSVFLLNSTNTISIKNILISCLLFISVGFIWQILKPILLEIKNLKEFQHEGNRFIRNYEIFKHILLSTEKVELPQSTIILGNKESYNTLTFITNPFCAPCQEIHNIIKSILKIHANDLRINIIINGDLENSDEQSRIFFRTIMAVFIQKGEQAYLKAMDDWYLTKNHEQWQKINQINYNEDEIDTIYKQHKKWCFVNKLNTTPLIFINGYTYPKKYLRKYLPFFVNEIIEDDFLVGNVEINDEEILNIN